MRVTSLTNNGEFVAWQEREPTAPDNDDEIFDRVMTRITELRRIKGWSAARLAEACAAQRMPRLNRDVIANLECGRRRDLGLSEAAVLARALGISLDELISPKPLTVQQKVR